MLQVEEDMKWSINAATNVWQKIIDETGETKTIPFEAIAIIAVAIFDRLPKILAQETFKKTIIDAMMEDDSQC